MGSFQLFVSCLERVKQFLELAMSLFIVLSTPGIRLTPYFGFHAECPPLINQAWLLTGREICSFACHASHAEVLSTE